MRKISALILIMLLFASCIKSSFSLTSSTLSLEKIDDRETLVFRSSIISEGEDERYSITIKDPNGYLTWRTELSEVDGYYIASLDITKGSSFLEGEYQYTIFGSNGTETEGSVLFLKDDWSLFLDNGVLSGDISFDLMRSGEAILLGDEAREGDVITFSDTRFNSYSITL